MHTKVHEFHARDWQGYAGTTRVAGRLIHTFELWGQNDIALIQTHETPDIYAVVYGLEVRRGLSFSKAASELGACLMHQLSCAGKMDA